MNHLVSEKLTPSEIRDVLYTICYFKRRARSRRETDIGHFLATGVTLHTAERLLTKQLMRDATALKLRTFWKAHRLDLNQSRRWDTTHYAHESTPGSDPIEVRQLPSSGLLEEWHRYAIDRRQTAIVTLAVETGDVLTLHEALWVTLVPQTLYISPKP